MKLTDVFFYSAQCWEYDMKMKVSIAYSQ